MPYTQSKKFWRPPHQDPIMQWENTPNVEEGLLKYVIESVEPGNLDKTIDAIDEYCKKYWMMNLGPEKGAIIDAHVQGKKISKVIEIGGYCGYSGLRFARLAPQAQVLTIEINPYYANIARQIQKHAGVGDRIRVHEGTVQVSGDVIKSYGSFDMVFIDHIKTLYIQDFQRLQQYGVIQKGALVIGDNIIRPGAPDYLEIFKHHNGYNSVLQHSYLQYSDIPDAVLISEKIQ